MEQILASKELCLLIDEIFWEHHVLNSPMVQNGWDGDLKAQRVTQTLIHSYDYFTRLRKAGIRTHSWV